MNLALFDFDGTITSTDTYSPFIRFAVSRLRLAAGTVCLGPLVAGHRLGLVSTSRARLAVTNFAFRGADAGRIQALGAVYAASELPRTLQRWALDRLAWHSSQGDDVVIVSASLDAYIRPWCEARGFSWICTTLEERAGRLTGRCVEGDCTGPEKARRIRDRYDLAKYESIYAYGDSGEDRAMLELAHAKYYRGRLITGWSDVTSFGHPQAPRSTRNRTKLSR